MKFKVEIELGNDAMQTTEDVAGALKDVVRELTDAVAYVSRNGEEHGTIRDGNGNLVGQWYFAKEEQA